MKKMIMSLGFAAPFLLNGSSLEQRMDRVKVLLDTRQASKNMCAGTDLGTLVMYEKNMFKVSRDGGLSFKEKAMPYENVIGMSCQEINRSIRLLVTVQEAKGPQTYTYMWDDSSEV